MRKKERYRKNKKKKETKVEDSEREGGRERERSTTQIVRKDAIIHFKVSSSFSRYIVLLA